MLGGREEGGEPVGRQSDGSGSTRGRDSDEGGHVAWHELLADRVRQGGAQDGADVRDGAPGDR